MVAAGEKPGRFGRDTTPRVSARGGQVEPPLQGRRRPQQCNEQHRRRPLPPCTWFANRSHRPDEPAAHLLDALPLSAGEGTRWTPVTNFPRRPARQPEETASMCRPRRRAAAAHHDPSRRPAHASRLRPRGASALVDCPASTSPGFFFFSRAAASTDQRMAHALRKCGSTACPAPDKRLARRAPSSCRAIAPITASTAQTPSRPARSRQRGARRPGSTIAPKPRPRKRVCASSRGPAGKYGGRTRNRAGGSSAEPRTTECSRAAPPRAKPSLSNHRPAPWRRPSPGDWPRAAAAHVRGNLGRAAAGQLRGPAAR